MLAANQPLYLTSVPVRYKQHPSLNLSMQPQTRPQVTTPARDCVVYLSYNEEGELRQGIRLPGTLAVLP